MSDKDNISVADIEEDGSAVAHIPETEAEKLAREADEATTIRAEDGEYHEEDDHEEVDPEREAIREARREERRLKKELQKQRDNSNKNLISSLKRQNEELAARLLKLESVSTSYQFAQLDKSIDDERTRVEYAKMRLQQAITAGDGAAHNEALELFTEANQKLQQLAHYKQQAVEAAKRPQQQATVPNVAVQKNYVSWSSKNDWFDPTGDDEDSLIARAIDKKLTSEGWDPSDPDYWEELDNRLAKRLPHHYRGNVQRDQAPERTQRRSVQTSSGRENSNAGANTKPGAYKLSPERVQAMRQAGVWNDPTKRASAIRAYQKFDREEAKKSR